MSAYALGLAVKTQPARQAVAGARTTVQLVRGGGEFGTCWHDAGRRGRLAHDDFAAAADLVKRGVTRRQTSRGSTAAS